MDQSQGEVTNTLGLIEVRGENAWVRCLARLFFVLGAGLFVLLLWAWWADKAVEPAGPQPVPTAVSIPVPPVLAPVSTLTSAAETGLSIPSSTTPVPVTTS